MSRLLIAVIAFSVGVVAVRLFMWDKIRESFLPRAIHSSDHNSPYALLEGRTVRLKPYDVTFEIPESWLNTTSQRNLYLSRQELNEVYLKVGGDAEHAQVMDSVLPFEDCAAHVGSKDWGNYLWNDLQARIYVVDLCPDEIAERIEKQGLDKASNAFDKASLSTGSYGEWQKRTLNVMQASSDFILFEDMDFYYHIYGNKTVVFVFIHAGDYDETISQILSSFR